METAIELAKAVVPILATAVFGLAVWLIKDARTMKREAQKEAVESRRSSEEVLTAVSLAMTTMLRQNLSVIHRRAMIDKQIRAQDRVNFFEMHHTYLKLGGNGPTSHLYKDISVLDVVD